MRKFTLLTVLVVFAACEAFSQGMSVKQFNFTTFDTVKQFKPEVMARQTSVQGRQHPEYGILPYDAQCGNCVELIDKRTATTRLFINPYQPNHSYSQSSYFPLHYNDGSKWRTIDSRLQPDKLQKNVYTAAQQPIPTKLDLNRQSSSIHIGRLDFEFNRNLTMYYMADNGETTQAAKGDYKTYSVGKDGLLVKNMWPGMDMQQVYKTGRIKTSFVLSAPLTLPMQSGFMVIEDHFTLPAGYTVSETGAGKYLTDGSYQGDYVITDKSGNAVVVYGKPVFYDALAWGMHGSYKLIQEDNNYTLQMFVPVSWLSLSTHTYPIIIDPIVSGVSDTGHFKQTGLPSAVLAFTTKAFGSCDYHLSDTVPGMSKLTNAYVDIEYDLQFDASCANFTQPSPFCTFTQASMEVLCDTCNKTTGQLLCNPPGPPFTGTCTTDPNLVPGAGPILINNFVPNYLSCLQPQCPDYIIDFTLKNRDSICGDVCGYLCAEGTIWRMTIEACTVEGSISQDKTQICAGEPVTFTAHPNCGVPPYHYYWVLDNGNTIDTVYNTPNLTIYPEANVTIGCYVADTCENLAQTNDLSVTVVQSPPADAGFNAQLCEGGTVQLGGTPTTNAGSTVQWTGENATVQGWLSGTNVLNPVATVPAGAVDTFFYVVRAQDFNCFRRDTVTIFSNPNPDAVIDTNGSTKLCLNQTVTLATTGSYSSYLWSNGATTPNTTVSQPGQYYVVVTDANGCQDTSNYITVSSVTPPGLNVYPDTLILYGDSVMLYTDVNLNSLSVDSFIWYPFTNISCTTCPNPVVAPLNDQYYSLMLYTDGCTISDSALIRVILPNNFYIPNAFTPNGDGNNDDFYVLSQSGVRVILFQVFNRLGEKMHEGNYPWNGTYKGKPAPPGVYVYLFKLGLFGDDRAVFRKGSVTLIR